MFIQRFESAKLVQSRYIIQEGITTKGSCRKTFEELVTTIRSPDSFQFC